MHFDFAGVFFLDDESFPSFGLTFAKARGIGALAGGGLASCRTPDWFTRSGKNPGHHRRDVCALPRHLGNQRGSAIGLELAQHYLLHSSLELNETAYLLGYEDANSFFRAFHQWEGTSPGEWRAVHAHRASSNHASASVA